MDDPVAKPTFELELWRYIEEAFGVRLPRRVLTPGHSSPFGFVADAFFRPWRDQVVWACRSGMKTLSASILATLDFRFAAGSLHGRVLSGSEAQAMNLYGYWARWCEQVLGDRLCGAPGRLVTRLSNGDFEILAATQRRVRGAKVQRLYRDEIDEIDGDVLAASIGMLAGTPGRPARVVDTSTWHRADGAMGRTVAESAGPSGPRLHKWNIWEALEQCPPERHARGEGCESCPLAAVCVAKAREVYGDEARRLGIAAECEGLLPIADAVRQFSRWSPEQWQAEAECRRPALDGMVYPGFDRREHVREYLDFDPSLPTWRAIDWGWNAFVCLWIQETKGGGVRVVDEYCAGSATTACHADEIARRDDARRIEATFCDPAGASRNDQTGYSDIEVFAAHGIPCRYSTSPWARDVHNGINLIRSSLRTAAGTSRLTVAGRCRRLIEAFESYRLRKVNGQVIDEPIKPQPCDHPMDALRYYFVNRWAPHRTETRLLRYA